MAIKKLVGQEEKPNKNKKSVGYEEKPKVQDFYRDNATKDGEKFVVEKVKKTENGWIVVETDEWVGFIRSNSTLGDYMMNVLAPSLHNKQGNQLVALAAKKAKNKFVLGLDDETRVWYHFDNETNLLTTSEEKEEAFLASDGLLSLEDFKLTE